MGRKVSNEYTDNGDGTTTMRVYTRRVSAGYLDVLIDTSEVAKVGLYQWSNNGMGFSASIDKRCVTLNRFLKGVGFERGYHRRHFPDGVKVVAINGNCLDCRLANLIIE